MATKKQPLLKIGKRRDQDPTQTLTLRNKFITAISQSFSKIKTNLKELIVKNNFLSAQEITANEKKYTYEYAAQKIDDFDKWLVSQIENNVLYTTLRPELIPMNQNWWGNTYIYSAYQKGIYQARADLNNIGTKLPELGNIVAEMNKPFHANRVALLYTRAFNGMKGVTNAMRAQMNHVLATGMAEGKGPYSIAYDLTNRVNKIGITRARLIARTEIIYAHNSATLSEYESLEGIVGEEIKIQWWTALDERVRPQHRQWHGNIYTIEQARSMIGAPNCLLETAMIYSPGLIQRSFKRFYDGPIVIINTASGNQLTCTPNHPILTFGGLIPAGLLCQGDSLLGSSKSYIPVSVSENKNDIISEIHNGFCSSALSDYVSGLGGMRLDFHGDGIENQITIININRELGNSINSKRVKHLGEFCLSLAGMKDLISSGDCPFLFDYLRILLASSGSMGAFDLVKSLFRQHLTPFGKFSFALGSKFDISFLQDQINSTSTALINFSKLIDRYAGLILIDDVVSIDYSSYVGHVYNLQTSDGFYLASDSINKQKGEVNYYITGNCRCGQLPYTETLAKAREKFDK